MRGRPAGRVSRPRTEGQDGQRWVQGEPDGSRGVQDVGDKAKAVGPQRLW